MRSGSDKINRFEISQNQFAYKVITDYKNGLSKIVTLNKGKKGSCYLQLDHIFVF